MNLLSDQILVEAYMKALVLESDRDLVELLGNEIHRRKLNIEAFFPPNPNLKLEIAIS